MTSAAPAAPGGKTILLEGHNLTLASGTGIATYARVLSQGLKRLGYDPAVLVETRRGFDRRDPVLSEIAFFDHERKRNLGHAIATEWRRLTSLPLPVKPFELPQLDTVVGPAAARLAEFRRILAVPHLLERERFHFKRYGKPLRIEPERSVAMMHATRPAPIVVPGVPNVYTLHDIVPLRLPYTTADDKKFYLQMIRHLCRHADHIVTVSEFSRQDIIKLTGMEPSRITNTYQAVRMPAVTRSEAEIARDLEAIFGLSYQGYFLFAGAIEPKKNLSRLIDAYAASGAEAPLVVAGALGWMYEGDVEKMASERFVSYEISGSKIVPKRRVQRLSYLPFEHLMTLMQGAKALLFPSIYEGFGLPVLEAMALGTPVMTSNVSSLPEIAGGAALLVDPYDVDGMAAAIRTLDRDADLRADLAARGPARAAEFSPERYDERLRSLYAKLI